MLWQVGHLLMLLSRPMLSREFKEFANRERRMVSLIGLFKHFRTAGTVTRFLPQHHSWRSAQHCVDALLLLGGSVASLLLLNRTHSSIRDHL